MIWKKKVDTEKYSWYAREKLLQLSKPTKC